MTTGALQGLLSWQLERTFCEAVAARFGAPTATLTLWLLAGSAGMFHAATAFLPSTFTMLAVLAVWTAWLGGAYGPAIAIACYTILLVWPFSVLLYVPLGLAALFAPTFGLVKVLRWGIGSSLLLAGVDAGYNSLYCKFIGYGRPFRRFNDPSSHKQSAVVCGVLSPCFDRLLVVTDGKPLLASWEIFYYNVLQDNGGPELYGTEPASFYAVNLALNFNGAFVLAAALPAALPLAMLFGAGERQAADGTGGTASAKEKLLYLAPLYVWFCFYTSLPHKEERFLCPCYPLLCLAAATALGAITHTWTVLLEVCGAGRGCATGLMSAVTKLAVLSICVASALRGAALYVNYAAPLHVYGELSASLAALPPSAPPAVVCVGKEWYRFPSSFFLPEEKFTLSFLHDGPASQLPQPYSRERGTAVAPPNMNDQNREEPSRYVAPETCDYLVELLLDDGNTPEHKLDPLDENVCAYTSNPPWLVYRPSLADCS